MFLCFRCGPEIPTIPGSRPPQASGLRRRQHGSAACRLQHGTVESLPAAPEAENPNLATRTYLKTTMDL